MKIYISWIDNSTDESAFVILKNEGSSTSELARIDYANGQWALTGEGTLVTKNILPSSTGERFEISYEEDTYGSYTYSVKSESALGVISEASQPSSVVVYNVPTAPATVTSESSPSAPSTITSESSPSAPATITSESSSTSAWEPSSTTLWLDSDDSSKIIFDDLLISSASTLELYVGARLIDGNGNWVEITKVNSATSFDMVDNQGNVYNQSNGTALNTSNVNAITFHSPSLSLSGVWYNDTKTIDWGDGAVWAYEAAASTRVTKWSDKSANNNHAIQSSNALQPSDINLGDGIEFDGSNDGFILTNDISENDMSVFVVMEGDGFIFANNEDSRILFYDNPNHINVGFNNLYWQVENQQGGIFNKDITNHDATKVQILEFNKNGSNLEVRVNGVIEYTESITAGSTRNFSIDRIGIRWDSNTSVRTWDGNISEIIAVTSTTDREKIEGYLAHKWGLEADLPSNHTYKSSAP